MSTPSLGGPVSAGSRRSKHWTLALLTLFIGTALASSCGDEETKSSSPSAPKPCTVDAECDDEDPCSRDFCGEAKTCTSEAEPDGRAPVQVDGDCRETFCTDGRAADQIDDGDVPDDDEPCTLDGCTEGIPTHEDQIDGASCTIGLGIGACDDGVCRVPCTPLTAASQCDDLDPCTNDGCVGEGFCEHTVLSGPVPGFPQVAGDCMEHRCVEGEEEDVEDPADFQDDGNECTVDKCTAGTPVNEPSPAGVPCSGDAYVCDGRGSCVECVSASDCDRSGSACFVYACVEGYCQPDPEPAGTPAPGNMQASGDCQLLVCDGGGGFDTQPADDPPPDDGNACTTEGCVSGSVAYDYLPQGSSCGGGKVCDGQGYCCTPATCGNKNCGTISDGCGGVVNCGVCAPGDTCGLGIQNVCGCTDGIQNGAETSADCGGACGAGCANGTPCSTGSDCSSGFCADGVCCSSACGGACKACVQAKTGVANGTCANVTTGTDPDNECVSQAASTCGTTGTCGAGACAFHASGTVCAPASCLGSTQTNADTCNGAGQCVDQGAVQCAVPYTCVGPACQSCSDGIDNGNESDVDCGGGGACAGCGLGKLCTTGSDCASGFCTDGVCCDTTCNGLCVTCNLAATKGTCSYLPQGQDPDSECPGQNSCNGNGGCN